MVRQANKTRMEVFQPGDTVLYSGEYVLVDEQGIIGDYELVTLDEGERFPMVQDGTLCYRLNDTCMDEPCEVIGGTSREVR